MKHLIALFMTIGLVAACGGDDGDGGTDPVDDTELAADIEEDRTLTSDNVYTLKTNVFVRNATLTIEPGTTILGEANTSLVITNTGRIDAAGTASAPIVFTSAQPEGSRASGDWGGVVLLGTAPINVAGGEDSIEGFPAGTAGTEFGGSDSSHDCGTLQYVRIEFAGFELSTDNELNGLTVGGCGSGTALDFVQIHKGADDGIEFFGGTAGVTHLLVTQPDDDGLDWDMGWSGNAQFVIVQQNGIVGNHAFESDNNGNNNDAMPRSSPTIYNATLVGSDAEPGQAGKTQSAMMLRRGTAGELGNFIITHFADYAVDVADDATIAQAQSGALSITSSCFFDNANDDTMGWPAGFDDDSFDEAAHFSQSAHANLFDDPVLVDPTNLSAPDFAPASSSPMLGAGQAPPNGFDTSATYIGAIGTEDWTRGWTAYPAD